MTVRAFVDTNILIYAYDTRAGIKHDLARGVIEALWREGNGVVSTQVLQELYVNLRRKVENPLRAEVARQLIAHYLTWTVVVNDGASVLTAIEYEQRFQLSFWDALIVQAANRSGTAVLYSEDLNHGQQYGAVRVENPLLVPTEA